jgi:hypothetical protein
MRTRGVRMGAGRHGALALEARRCPVVASAWTVSARRTGDRWAGYYEGRPVVDGYERASEATWALSFLARGERPPYVPEGADVAWPSRDGGGES